MPAAIWPRLGVVIYCICIYIYILDEADSSWHGAHQNITEKTTPNPQTGSVSTLKSRSGLAFAWLSQSVKEAELNLIQHRADLARSHQP